MIILVSEALKTDNKINEGFKGQTVGAKEMMRLWL